MTTAVYPAGAHRTRTGLATLPPLSRNNVEAFPCPQSALRAVWTAVTPAVGGHGKPRRDGQLGARWRS
jgi:hypothetical protein